MRYCNRLSRKVVNYPFLEAFPGFVLFVGLVWVVCYHPQMNLPHLGPHVCVRGAPGVVEQARRVFIDSFKHKLASIPSFPLFSCLQHCKFFSWSLCDTDGLGVLSFFLWNNLSLRGWIAVSLLLLFVPMTLFNLSISSCSLAMRESRLSTCSHLTQLLWLLPYDVKERLMHSSQPEVWTAMWLPPN